MMAFQLNAGDVNGLNQLLTGAIALTYEEKQDLSLFATGNCLFQISPKQRFNLKIIASEEEMKLFET
jgi:hypothetical protein